MAQEYGIFLVGLKIDYKPDTGEFVAWVTIQVEAFGISKRLRRQVASVTFGQLYQLIQDLLGNLIIVKGLPWPAWMGDAPEAYTPTYTGVVEYDPILSPGPEIVSVPDWEDMDPSIYGPPEEEP